MSLYQDNRPTSLKKFIGNKPVISAIQNMVDTDKIPPVILFHGSHGSGKTTLARLIPKLFGVNRADIKELDIGSTRGIDNIRELREQSLTRPFSSPYRFYILDEFHAATPDAKTAALKWLEDTPNHVKIVICTTEAAKLPGTVKSRCTPFSIKPLNPKEMAKVISNVCIAENIELADSVIEKIIGLADGIPRQALVYVESVIGLSEDDALEIIQSVSGETAELKALFNCLLKKTDWAGYCQVIKALKEDPETIRRSVLGYVSAIMLNQSSGKEGFLNRLAAILEIFENNWYDNGKSGLVKACYEVCCLGRK